MDEPNKRGRGRPPKPIDPTVPVLKGTVNPNHLPKLLRKIKELNDDAVQVLHQALSSDDEKVRLEAAKVVLKYNIDISAEAHRQSLANLIAELRAKSAGQIKDDDATKPLVTFSNIIDVDAV